MSAPIAVRVLSFHSTYRCRHRGRCCTSGWPIEMEPVQYRRLRDAQLAPPGPSPDDEPVLLEQQNGRCVFHDGDSRGGCTIHRALGHGALPLACRQFPRMSLHDPRGVSVTLSHYCPTAAGLLEATGPVSVVTDPPAFPGDAEYVGLTTDSRLPPLLHPALAMDWESWWAFEAMSVALLETARDPLPRLALAVEHARTWTVDAGPLTPHLREAFTIARNASVLPDRLTAEREAGSCTLSLAAIPETWRPTAEALLSSTDASSVTDHVTRRYLAAHAFANWAAYQGRGLRTWYRSVEAAAHLLARTGDPGDADLVLRHLADTSALIERWDELEGTALI